MFAQETIFQYLMFHNEPDAFVLAQEEDWAPKFLEGI